MICYVLYHINSLCLYTTPGDGSKYYYSYQMSKKTEGYRVKIKPLILGLLGFLRLQLSIYLASLPLEVMTWSRQGTAFGPYNLTLKSWLCHSLK